MHVTRVAFVFLAYVFRLTCTVATHINMNVATSGPEEANSSWLGQYSHYVEMTGSKCGTAMIVATS